MAKTKRGRPRRADEQALAKMAVLLASGEFKSERKAAAEAVPLAEPGSSTEAIIDRLRTNYRARREALQAWARERLEAQAPPRTGIDTRSLRPGRASLHSHSRSPVAHHSRPDVTATSRDAIFRRPRGMSEAEFAMVQLVRQRHQLEKLAKGEPLEGDALAAFRKAIEGED